MDKEEKRLRCLEMAFSAFEASAGMTLVQILEFANVLVAFVEGTLLEEQLKNQ